MLSKDTLRIIATRTVSSTVCETGPGFVQRLHRYAFQRKKCDLTSRSCNRKSNVDADPIYHRRGASHTIPVTDFRHSSLIAKSELESLTKKLWKCSSMRR